MYVVAISHKVLKYVFAASQLSGSHGEWTSWDDLDNEVRHNLEILDRLFAAPAPLVGLDRALAQAEVIPPRAPLQVQAVAVNPPAPVRICFAFRDTGVCGRANCRFRHERAPEVPRVDHPPAAAGPQNVVADQPIPPAVNPQIDMYVVALRPLLVTVYRENPDTWWMWATWFELAFWSFLYVFSLPLSLLCFAAFYKPIHVVLDFGVIYIGYFLFSCLRERRNFLIDYRAQGSVALDLPFGTPVFYDVEKWQSTGHYLGYKAYKEVEIYPEILKKMLVRVGGSLNCPPSTFNNVLGWGMKEYEGGDYEIMHNTSGVCVQQILAAKERARYMIGSNSGVGLAPAVSLG